MSKNETAVASRALVVRPAGSDTCQDLGRMDQLLAALPEVLQGTKKSAEAEAGSLKSIGIRATIDAPSPFWMVKSAPGYDATYYKSVNTRVADAVIKSGVVSDPENVYKYTERVRNYAAEWIMGQIDLGCVVDATGAEVEISDAVFEKLGAMADRTPAGLERTKAAKAARANEEGGAQRPDDVRAHDHVLAAFKIAFKSEGAWAVKYQKALKALVSPEEIAALEAKADKPKLKTK